MSERFETKRGIKAIYKYSSYPFLFGVAKSLVTCHFRIFAFDKVVSGYRTRGKPFPHFQFIAQGVPPP